MAIRKTWREYKMTQIHRYNRQNHPNSDKDNFWTPMYIIYWLKDKFGDYMYDAACDEHNKKGQYIDIFKEPIPHDDMSWIYINPPFDMASVFEFVIHAARWADAGWPIVMLLPNKLCSRGYVTQVNNRLDHIIYLGGRINFEGPYACKGGASMNGCFVGIMDRSAFDGSMTTTTSIALADIKRRYK